MDELSPETGANGDTKPVGSPQAGILHTLVSIARSVRALLGLRLAELGLGNGQDEILMALKPAEAVSPAILATRLGIRETMLTKLLDPLLAKELVERSGEIGAGQRVTLRISPAGAEMQDRVRNLWNEVGNDLVGADGSEQLDLLIEELESLQKQMDVRLTRFC